MPLPPKTTTPTTEEENLEILDQYNLTRLLVLQIY